MTRRDSAKVAGRPVKPGGPRSCIKEGSRGFLTHTLAINVAFYSMRVDSTVRLLAGHTRSIIAVAALIGAATTLVFVLRRRASKSVPTQAETAVLLVDNGSLRPASTHSLRRIASRLASHVRFEVVPTSVKWSDSISAADLAGVAAETTKSALIRLAATGIRRAILLPVFVGPSETISKTLPSIAAAVRQQFPALEEVTVAAPLIRGEGDGFEGAVEVAGILAGHVRRTVTAHAWSAPDAPLHVAVCDHGSPSRPVNAVRNHVAALVAAALPAELVVRGALCWCPGQLRATHTALLTPPQEPDRVGPCSMERRPEPTFDFNEPTLEARLASIAAQVRWALRGHVQRHLRQPSPFRSVPAGARWQRPGTRRRRNDVPVARQARRARGRRGHDHRPGRCCVGQLARRRCNAPPGRGCWRWPRCAVRAPGAATPSRGEVTSMREQEEWC